MNERDNLLGGRRPIKGSGPSSLPEVVPDARVVKIDFQIGPDGDWYATVLGPDDVVIDRQHRPTFWAAVVSVQSHADGATRP